MRYNTTGSYNTAIGFESLAFNTTASNNTAVGYQAGYSTVSGSGGITAIGWQALYTNSTGAFGVAIGQQAAYSNTTGQPVAIGAAALYAQTTPNGNTAVGHNAASSTTTGDNNTAVGRYSLVSNTTASNNTAVGYQAGYSNSTNQNCTFVGFQAGYASIGDYNCLIGRTSGQAITTGAKNTIIGSYSGNGGGLDIRTSSNNIVLSDGDGNPWGQYVDQGGSGKGWRFQGNTASASFVSCIETMQICSNRAFSQDFGLFIISNTTTNNASAIRFYSSTAGAVVGSITYSGSLTTYNSTSDYRLKNITGPLTGTEAKEFVMALQPKQGSWKFDNSKFVGFIAHEFQAVSPSSVNGIKDAVDEEGKPVMQSMQASSPEVIANLVAHIQNLETRLAALEAK